VVVEKSKKDKDKETDYEAKPDEVKRFVSTAAVKHVTWIVTYHNLLYIFLGALLGDIFFYLIKFFFANFTLSIAFFENFQ
jgi:hypothetical protein